MNNFDAVVAGSGFAGSVAARELAEKGKKVLVIEKRPHTCGSAYDKPDEAGVPVHMYGPHIFHTQKEEIYKYINRYGKWFDYRHKVLGSIDGKLVPIPFNFTSMETLLGKEISQKLQGSLLKFYGERETVTVNELMQNPGGDIKRLGEYVFEKVFLHYTAKQWGIPAENVDKSVLSRVPVVLGYYDGYFSDKYQCMPEISYSAFFDSLLNHNNIKVLLNCDALSLISIKDNELYFEGKPFNGDVVYTGAADELFGYAYGSLPYRSVYMQFEKYDIPCFQPAAVVNYPNDYEFTRITEFKHFYGKKGKGTTVLKEFPLPYDKNSEKGNVPYYVISNKENSGIYARYKALSDGVKNLHLCGRLAEYRYYNMDAVIERAIDTVKNIK